MDIERRLSKVLSEFVRTLGTDFSIQLVLDRLVQRIVEILPVDGAGVTLISFTSAPYQLAASDDVAQTFVEIQSETGEGPGVLAIETGAPVVVTDLEHDHRFPRFSRTVLAAGLTSAYTFPLRHGDRRLGALDLYCKTVAPLPAEAMAAAQTLADVAAACLWSAQTRAELTQSSQLANRSSVQDVMTGLDNRSVLLRRLEAAAVGCREADRVAAVVSLDIDRFTQLNETYGRAAGDELLMAVATRLTSVLRQGDTAARLGGDEFAVLFAELGSVQEADPLLSDMVAELAKPFDLAAGRVRMSVSVGMAFINGENCRAKPVLRQADMAMTHAKNLGGDQQVRFDPSMLERHLSRLEHDDDLRQAFQDGQFCLHYQPVVDLSGRVVGLEALARWNHPTRGLVGPAEFIPIMEYTGLIIEFGAWAIDRACEDVAQWQALAGCEQLTVAVNLSAVQMLDRHLPAMIASTLERHRIDGRSLCLEMTESVLIDDSELVTEAMSTIHDLGINLAVDDFGTGYSSLLSLRRFPVDALKLDRMLISGIHGEGKDLAIVTSVVELAHSLGLVAIAEGVETVEQLDALSSIGCDFAQGYLWSPGVPFGDVGPLLATDAMVTDRDRDRDSDSDSDSDGDGDGAWPSPKGERSVPTRQFRHLVAVMLIRRSDQDRSLWNELDASEQFRVVAEAADARTASALAQRTRPDLALLSIELAEGNGVQVVKHLRRSSPGTRIVLLSNDVSPEVHRAAEEAGVVAVLDAACPIASLLDRLRALAVPTAAEVELSPMEWWLLGRPTPDASIGA